MKRLIAFFLAILTFVSIGAVPVSANGIIDEEAMYRYAYAASVSSTLTFSGTTASCSSKGTGKADVTAISATQYLQKKQGSNWGTVRNGTWSQSVSGSLLTMNNSKSGNSSGTYRLKTVFTVTTKSGQTETITVYSAEKTI